jgi:serine/threonine protein kinase
VFPKRAPEAVTIPSETSQPPVTPGQIIGGRYLVGTLIGEGGMGLVCAATHLGLESPVAIKLIRPDLKHDAEFVERFLNEARRAAALRSEHVATVHDVGRLETGEPYLVMERLEGVELETYLRATGPLEPTRAVELMLEACEGLAAAHAAGIVHRDLKPANLFLARRSDGKEVLKILDFGISKAVTDDAPSSSTSRSLGSPWYMSPEQMLDASSVDFRADIWSLGVVLFELLTTKPPFDGQSVAEVCVKVLTGRVPSPAELRPGLDRALELIVLRCLQKDREQRYATVQELELDLRAFLANSANQLAENELAVNEAVNELALNEAVNEDRASDRYGSLAPMSDEFDVIPQRRRSRSRALGIFGVAATLLLAAGTVGIAALESTKVDLRTSLSLPLSSLDPGPEALPLDKGNEPVTAAVVGPVVGDPAPATAPVSTASVITTSAPATPAAPVTTHAIFHPPPTLTPREIEHRKARYEAWLHQQGLKRLDETASE